MLWPTSGTFRAGTILAAVSMLVARAASDFFWRYAMFSVETMSQENWLAIVNFVLGIIVFFLLFLFVFWLVRQVIANERACKRKQEEDDAGN
jgi:heme/copper-type cytochrome/quinol oxidase subunit 2